MTNKAISEHFRALGKKGGKKSWEVRRKKILDQIKRKVAPAPEKGNNNKKA